MTSDQKWFLNHPAFMTEAELHRRHIKAQIRSGKIPRYMFITQPVKGFTPQLERKRGKRGRMKLTWKITSTLDHLSPKEAT